MTWEWYSDGNITDAQLTQAINRMKETAWVHDAVNFPGAPSPDLLTRLKQSVTDGYMKIACNVLNDGSVDQAFLFQKSGWLTAQLETPVWNVSYGFLQSLLPDNADQATCRTFIQQNMTPTMDVLMTKTGVSFLFSIDNGTPDANPLGRKIGRLQTLGAGDQWAAVGTPRTFRGSDTVHEYYGKPVSTDWEFTVTKIERISS